MGYSLYFKDGRWAGYGVPAECDQATCTTKIDRGLYYRCERCELFFCTDHLWIGRGGKAEPQMCQRCCDDESPFEPKPDVLEWEKHMLTDPSWEKWREENPQATQQIKANIANSERKTA